jgi:hypothetical protein
VYVLVHVYCVSSGDLCAMELPREALSRVRYVDVTDNNIKPSISISMVGGCSARSDMRYLYMHVSTYMPSISTWSRYVRSRDQSIRLRQRDTSAKALHHGQYIK